MIIAYSPICKPRQRLLEPNPKNTALQILNKNISELCFV